MDTLACMNNECPKCGTQKTGESCPKCGLVFAKFNPKVLENNVPESIKALWQNVEQDWNDQSRHALFVEQSIIQGTLGYAAACYNRKKQDPIAKKQLDHISKRLLLTLNASASTSKSNDSRSKMIGPIVLIIVILLIIAGFFMLQSK